VPQSGLNRKLRKTLPKLLEEWDGQMPPPAQSLDPEVFAAQQRVFGYRAPSAVRTMRKKNERYLAVAEAAVTWYPPTEHDFKRSAMNELRADKRRLKKEGAPAQLVSENAAMLDIFRWTERQETSMKKIALLRRRGKGPPPKGKGKRASKAAKKK
jgi:hypothetical protein